MAAAVGPTAGSADAQTGAAGCPSALKISVAGALVAYDRYMPVTVERGDARQAQSVRRVRVELRDAVTSERFYTADLSRAEIRALVAGGADGAMTYVTSSPRGAGASYGEVSWTGADGCRGRRRTANVSPTTPRGPSRYRASLTPAGREGRVTFGGGEQGCLLSVAEPVRVTVVAGGRRRTARLDHSCGEWDARDLRFALPGVDVTLTHGSYVSAATLAVTARRSAGARRAVSVTVRQGNRRVLHARFEVRWRGGAAAGKGSVRLLASR